MRQILIRFIFGLCFLIFMPSIYGQRKFSDSELRGTINTYKKDPRGPYKEIRWFCDDGTIIPPKEECPDPGGVQHASYKEKTIEIAERNHVFFGQILTGQEKNDFWDEKNDHSKANQYLLETYLASIDDGWVSERAQYYRGAKQIEDESEWGQEFLEWLLNQKDNVENNYLQIRQLARDLPHFEETGVSQRVRAVSKTLSDKHSGFMDVRIKIHGNPESSDVALVRKYKKEETDKWSESDMVLMDSLEKDMVKMFQPIKPADFTEVIFNAKDTVFRNQLNYFQSDILSGDDGRAKVMGATELLSEIKHQLRLTKNGKERLPLIDLTNKLEQLVFLEESNWTAENLLNWSEKACYLGMGLQGAGYLEDWEWARLQSEIDFVKEGNTNIASMESLIRAGRKVVEWSSMNVKELYEKEVQRFIGFEPKAAAFIDNQIRSSIILPMGNMVSDLGIAFGKKAKLNNEVFDIPDQALIRGLNPGYAQGVLQIADQMDEAMEIDASKIYFFNRPPADMKPVAGIATVSEGNLVSHVQLLARNLGIPNAVLNDNHIKSLEKYNGKEIFYAVGPRGNVVMKLASNMSSEENKLFKSTTRNEQKVFVSIDSIKLEDETILNIAEVDATFSGKYSGPKAANFGQLKQMFPDHVVDGVVIPFSIFKSHMQQSMPGGNATYWSYLETTFSEAKKKESQNISEKNIEKYVLNRLETLADNILKMPLKPYFETQLEAQFQSVLNGQLGKVPVFLRSDTNMEDLKDFTGAGLNKTLFNVVSRSEILEGIKEVWASPYSERSYKWRQKFLLNPENVFPSILIIPSVNVDKSGVIITKGLTSGKSNSSTVAFSMGVGGAVDGQSAEMYELHPNGYDELLSPTGETVYRTIPPSGGSTVVTTLAGRPILNDYDLQKLRNLISEINERMPVATGKSGPYDIELGFKDGKIWIFQIRPFVENQDAANSIYLQSITSKIDPNMVVHSNTTL